MLKLLVPAAAVLTACADPTPVITPRGFPEPLGGAALALLDASAVGAQSPVRHHCGLGLGITEALPDPVDRPDREGEWVELGNPSPEAASLDGWTLTTGRRSLPLDGLSIGAGVRLRLGAEGVRRLRPLQLRNGSGSLALVDPCGLTVDRMTWGATRPLDPGWRVRGRSRFLGGSQGRLGPARSVPGGAVGGCGQT